MHAGKWEKQGPHVTRTVLPDRVRIDSVCRVPRSHLTCSGSRLARVHVCLHCVRGRAGRCPILEKVVFILTVLLPQTVMAGELR